MHLRTINTIALSVIIWLTNPALAEGALETFHDEAGMASFELEGINNQLHRLTDYQGKVVLVNFWASWCSPCIREIPSMQRLDESLLNRPFEIVAINVSEPKRSVIRQLKRINMTFTVLFDQEGKTFKQWQSKILPTSFLLDKNGHIRYQAQGPLEWDTAEVTEIIDKLLIE
ncbi:MAG: TlpA disulfide reductase family protein [Gammaproteobacteria bacterium]|nr:TlpA disulfide reductase family protein [Gammaproteobacteria bacterium]